jgi:RNA polymerase sigma factor (sigma-70 family)
MSALGSRPEELIEKFYAAFDDWTRACAETKKEARQRLDAIFDELVHALSPKLLRVVQLLIRDHWKKYRSVYGSLACHVIEEDAESAVNYSFANLWRTGQTGNGRWKRGGSSVVTWLARLAFNAYIIDKRGDQRHARRREDTGDSSLTTIVDPSPSPIESDMKAESEAHFLEGFRLAAGSLPDDQKQVVEGLSQGKTQREIAWDMETSEPTVSRLKYKALKMLRRLLKKLF